jgi:20S proteasome alpha/beta subunit
MTLAISTLTSSGIVLSADSRQTYRNSAGATRIGSDSAMKIFKLTGACGVAIAGRAFIREKNQPRDIGFFVNRFAESESLDGLSAKDIAEKLNKYLGDLFVSAEMDALKKQIEQEIGQLGGTKLKFFPADAPFWPYFYLDKNGNAQKPIGSIETVNLIVAGVDEDDIGRAYSVLVPKGITNQQDTASCGAIWIGQTDVLGRIVKGVAPELGNLAFVKDALIDPANTVQADINSLEYIINWGTITLQDAIDFCVLMTKTTESIQRFSDGTFLVPGGITGVGGEVDIAIITPERGFVWLKRKTLKGAGAELSLQDCPRRKPASNQPDVA